MPTPDTCMSDVVSDGLTGTLCRIATLCMMKLSCLFISNFSTKTQSGEATRNALAFNRILSEF